ncbi:MAG: DEAD/DEAH box helicase [Bacteroides sp.]
MNDFLSALKKPTFHATAANHYSDEEVFFCLDFDEKGGFITTVNKQLKEIQPDYHSYNGDTFNVLRSLNAIKNKEGFHITWEGADQRVYLNEYDYLIYQLIRCSNLCDVTGTPIRPEKENGTLALQLRCEEKRFTSSFLLCTENENFTDFQLLSDSFALANQHIYALAPLGENFEQLHSFCSTFTPDMLETFLSVFFSYLENVQLIYEDYTLMLSSEEISTAPAIVFEKVDEDLALLMHLTHTLPNADHQVLEQFDLTQLALVNEMEHQVVLKRIIRQSLAGYCKQVYKTLSQYAPDKESKKNIYQDGNFFLVPAEVAGPFLLHAMPTLIKDFVLLGAEKLCNYKIKLYRPKLKVNLSSGIDFLEGEASLQFDDESISLADALAQYKKTKYIVLASGDRAVIDETYLRRLDRLFKQSKNKKKVSISFFDLPEVEELLNERMETEVFVKHRQVFEGFRTLSDTRMQLPGISATLRPYQRDGVKWINYLYANQLGGCLADDMGLGKTIQTLAMLTRIYPKTKQTSLVVMPKSLLFNWQNELQKFAPQLTAYTFYGNTRCWEEAEQHQLILTTYAMVRSNAEDFCQRKFHYVILDESQNIKNVTTQVTQAVNLLQAKHRLALSGTPIENNLTELYSLFRFLNPAMFGSLEDFNKRYTYPIQKDNDKEAMVSLRKKIYPFMLRRLKKDVLTDLPDRMEQTLYVDMSPEQEALYEQRRTYYYQQVKQTIQTDGLQKSQMVMFQALNELRRIASVPESVSDGRIASPKLDVLMEYVDEAVSNNHKVVIFFNYIAGIELVGEKLDEYGIDFVSMTGSTRDRQSLVERFQNDTHCKVFLMTLKTGGVGLNLTAADVVFIFEPWWNKAAEEQAINRLHRIGQLNKVMSYSILTSRTIEEKIRLLQEQKAELFAELIGSDATSSKSLSEEDIDYILG